MKKTKILSVILSTLLVSTSLIGCGDKASSGNNSGEADDNSPIKFSFYSEDGVANDFSDPIAKKITETTGVTLEIDYPVGGNNQRIPLMIASGEYPDLIYAKGDTPKLIEAGALIPLDDLIEEHAPNIKKLYGDYLQRLKHSEEDPSIYTLGAYQVDTAIWSTAGTMQLQNAVLEDLGYPEIKTIYDYEEAIKAYIEKYPTIDGQPTIGLSLCADDWKWLITVGNPAGLVAGYTDDGQWLVDDETFEATYKFYGDDLKEYFKWLNHMNDEGLLDPESFTQKTDQYLAKLASGRVLGITDAEWHFNEAEVSLAGEGKEERTYARLPVVMNEETTCSVMKSQGYSAAFGVGISTSCKDPVRAIKFLDWMASDEAQILNNWGIEGVNYEIVDGKRVVPAEEQEKKNNDKDYGKKTGLGQYSYPFPQRGDGVEDSTGQYYTPTTEQTIIDNYNSAAKKTLEAYGVDMWKDLFPPTSDFEVSPYGAAYNIAIPNDSELTLLQKKADDYCQKTIPQIILAGEANFETEWEKMQKDLKAMNIEEANKQMTELISQTMEFWGTK